VTTIPLPDAPSLEQLKHQALELLRAAQAQEPEALARLHSHLPQRADPALTLSQAQFVLAREYGFPSWPRLKAHVDSLAPDPVEQFKTEVQAGKAGRVRSLLRRYPKLREQINAPLFVFDAPAVIAAKNNRPLLEVLLANGADINARSQWWAGSFGILDNTDPETAEYLIDQGARLDVHSAAGLGRLDRVKEMVAEQPELVNARGGDGQTPLHVAKTPEIAAFLLDHGAELEIRDIDHGSTPAQYAVGERHDVCRLLLSRGAQDDIFMRCGLGDVEAVRAFFSADPSLIHATVDQGPHDPAPAPGFHIYHYYFGSWATPLLAAARADQRAVVEMLLARGADINAPHDGASALHLAAWEGHTEMVRLLLAQGADRNQIDPNYHGTAAGWASHNGKSVTKDALLSDAGIIDAAGFGLEARVRTLLDADPSLVNGPHPGTGARPLHTSLWNGHLEITRLLLECGADPKLTEHGKTVLDVALETKNEAAVELVRQYLSV
jgi:ankyrin repeat protein